MNTQALATFLAACLLVTACGGSQAADSGATPGQTHSTSGDGSTGGTESGDDIDGPLGGDTDSSTDGGETPDSTDTASDSPVTFKLKNTGDESLFLNMDKGWQAVIYAYSGTPPNAKSILMFPTHCTASCDAAPEDICPVCEEPERVAEIKAAENHDEVAPGDSRLVPWDGLAFQYKKARGKRAKCKCYGTAEPAPETYTIKACGLRKTQSAKARSKYQCVESSLTIPVEEPVVVELDFGNP